jgi:hypothetical protein
MACRRLCDSAHMAPAGSRLLFNNSLICQGYFQGLKGYFQEFWGLEKFWLGVCTITLPTASVCPCHLSSAGRQTAALATGALQTWHTASM